MLAVGTVQLHLPHPSVASVHHKLMISSVGPSGCSKCRKVFLTSEDGIGILSEVAGGLLKPTPLTLHREGL